MNGSSSKLIFVYNASSGKAAAAIDWAHKIISPSTYNCSLCSITYGNLGMKKEWKRFIQNLSIDVEFLYKDNFDPLKQNVPLPAVFEIKDEIWSIIVTSDELNRIKNCTELIEILQEKLA